MAKELFADYVKEKKLREPKEKKELAQTLKTFYVEGRKKDGSSYSLRFGLNRHFKSTRGIDIMNDVEFNKANKVFTAQCVQLKKDGQAKVQHKPPILKDDLKKLYESGVFNSDHPKMLLNKVFFAIMLCFCRYGRQNLRQLKKAAFKVHTDATGAKFVSKVCDKLTKNHREDDEAGEGGVMYATEGVWCPVASFEQYLQHLNPKLFFISTTQERGQLRCRSLVRQHGSWRALVGQHDEANIKGCKPVMYLYKSFHPSYSRHYS